MNTEETEARITALVQRGYALQHPQSTFPPYEQLAYSHQLGAHAPQTQQNGRGATPRQQQQQPPRTNGNHTGSHLSRSGSGGKSTPPHSTHTQIRHGIRNQKAVMTAEEAQQLLIQQGYTVSPPKPKSISVEEAEKLLLEKGFTLNVQQTPSPAPVPPPSSPPPSAPNTATTGQTSPHQQPPLQTDRKTPSEALSLRMYLQEKADRLYVERLFLLREEFHQRQKILLDEAHMHASLLTVGQYEWRLKVASLQHIAQLQAVEARMDDETLLGKLRKQLNEATNRVNGEREAVRQLHEELAARDADRRIAVETAKEAWGEEKILLLKRLDMLETQVATMRENSQKLPNQPPARSTVMSAQPAPPDQHVFASSSSYPQDGDNLTTMAAQRQRWAEERVQWRIERDAWERAKSEQQQLLRQQMLSDEERAVSAASELKFTTPPPPAPKTQPSPFADQRATSPKLPQRVTEHPPGTASSHGLDESGLMKSDPRLPSGMTGMLNSHDLNSWQRVHSAEIAAAVSPFPLHENELSTSQIDAVVARTNAALARASRLLEKHSSTK